MREVLGSIPRTKQKRVFIAHSCDLTLEMEAGGTLQTRLHGKREASHNDGGRLSQENKAMGRRLGKDMSFIFRQGLISLG